jgi:hypothetical protein
MKRAILETAVNLAERLGHIFVTTVGADGLPHVAAAGRLGLDRDGRAEVTAWFCPATVENLQANPAVSLVVWDPETDTGYQLLGRNEQLLELAVMDGYIPGSDEQPSFPQVERKMVVRVETVLDFKHAPHSDLQM